MTDRMDDLLRRELIDLPPYAPAAPAYRELERLVKLDANENPYGPSPAVLAALNGTRVWNRYATQDELRPAIANYVGVQTENVVVGNGADEVTDLIQRVFVTQGDGVVDCPPTFEMYDKYARLNGARVISVPRRDDFSLDVGAIEQAVRRERAKLLFIANPNNPDGSLTPRGDIERLLALPAVVVLDEAYAEFAGETLVGSVLQRSNLVVVRTFSKWAALAGLRIGYCAAPKPIADAMLRAKSPYNVNAAGLVAARAALEDKEYLLANVRRNVAERERLAWALAGLPFLRPLPSRTNFILCRVVGVRAAEVRDRLAKRGILIRAFGSPHLRPFVRISVGTCEEDDALLRALEKIFEEE